jgi:hypothetical protein
VLVFVARKNTCDFVANMLNRVGIRASAMHSDRTQVRGDDPPPQRRYRYFKEPRRRLTVRETALNYHYLSVSVCASADGKLGKVVDIGDIRVRMCVCVTVELVPSV